MGKETGIAWTDHTFSPWWGCVKVSPACTNCYAETFAKRLGFKVWGPESVRRKFGDKHWNEPLRWNAAAERDSVRRRVFCSSMADVFEDHPDIGIERLRLFALIEATPSLDWQLLTKRPENLSTMLPLAWLTEPRKNVWLGTTVENQEYAEQRLPDLLSVDAAVHFVSYEPALGYVDFRPWLDHECGTPPHSRCPNQIDWIIAGGESGPRHRPPVPAWFQSVRDQCKASRTRFFFKQHGGARPTDGGDLLDGVRHKQFPETPYDVDGRLINVLASIDWTPVSASA